MSNNKKKYFQQLSYEQVKEIIPQRFPFLMLDRVAEIQPAVRAVGIKNLTGNEWYFQGHFPKKAITPGAVVSEAVAQTAIVLFRATYPSGRREGIFLVGAMKARFFRPTFPGDQLRIEVTATKLIRHAGIFVGKVNVGDLLVARIEFSMSSGKTFVE